MAVPSIVFCSSPVCFLLSHPNKGGLFFLDTHYFQMVFENSAYFVSALG